MKNYTFHFEVQTLIEQFIEAFNDVVIKRYDKNKQLIENSDIAVNYIYAPKQRVLETLTNPAPGGITLPAIAINVTSITRDTERVVNKISGYNVPYTISSEFDVTRYLKHIPSPVPINIGINMNIFTKYQADMDQIVSNFLPYCDPYIIISWRMPIPENEDNIFELRSEVLYGNNLTLTYPDSLQGNQVFRCSANCTFTIKGWLFKAQEENVPKIIYIDKQMYPVGVTPSESKLSLLKSLETTDSLTPVFSAAPFMRSVDKWYTNQTFNTNPTEEFNLVGSYFLSINDLYVSGSKTSALSGNLVDDFFNSTLSTKYPPFYGIKIPKEQYEIVSDKFITLNLPLSTTEGYDGYVNIIAVNKVGYGDLVSGYNSVQTNFEQSLNISSENMSMPSVSGIYVNNKIS